MKRATLSHAFFSVLMIISLAVADAGAVELRSKNAVTRAKTAQLDVVDNQLKIKVWAPVNRTVGAVMNNINFISPDGSTTSFKITGAFQVLNVARASVDLTDAEAQKVNELLHTKGTEVKVKMRIETFTYFVE